MDTIATLLALMIICLIVITPTVVFGNYIWKKIQDRKASK